MLRRVRDGLVDRLSEPGTSSPARNRVGRVNERVKQRSLSLVATSPATSRAGPAPLGPGSGGELSLAIGLGNG
jgi:hypothetical protein